MGPTRREAKHMHWHRYRHPQANPWPAAKTENELGHLALSLRLFFSPPLPPPPCFRLVHKVKRGLSLFAARANISSSYPPHSLTHPPSPPPPAPLHFRNGRGNTSGRRTHAPRRLPRGARHRLQTTIWRHVSTTTPVNCHLEKKILRGCCSLFSRAAIFTSSRPPANFLECGVFAWFVFCRGSTWNSRETRP